MTDRDRPYHAHIYYSTEQRPAAEALREAFVRLSAVVSEPHILFVGRLTDAPAGPHPIAQYEIHFLEASLPGVISAIEASGLRALVHPLTDDDLGSHNGAWIGEAVTSICRVDPPGRIRRGPLRQDAL